MADKVVLEAGGERVAMEMAYTIIRNIEKQEWDSITREEYLQVVAACSDALRGIAPG